MSREIRVGDRIKDNDPRMPNRVLTVVRLWFPLSTARYLDAKAICAHAGREFPIALRRIYTDGKPRRSGFSLLPEEA